MANPLLDRAPPQDFAGRRQDIELKAKIENFPRLVEIIEADLATLEQHSPAEDWRRAPVDIRLRFGWGDVLETVPVLTGRVATTIAAVCQRCLEAFALPLEVDLRLLLVQGRDSGAADAAWEVWELDEETVRPADLVEEALIMAMPLSAMHAANEQCSALPQKKVSKAGEMLRPFAHLREQMNDDSG